MIRLTDEDSFPRVEDAAERHLRLCTQSKNGAKYADLIKLFYNDFEDKRDVYKKAVKNTTFALDSTKLRDTELDDVLRDVNGRAKEYDRNNPGSNVESLLFPEGLTEVVNITDKAEPEAARGIAKKITSLGAEHPLNSFVSLIETAIQASELAFEELVTVSKAEGNANTDFVISKLKLVKQYNASYFVAANDFGKSFAEKLYPKLHTEKKEKPEETKKA